MTLPPPDKDMENGRRLFGMIAEGYDGQQITERFAIPSDRIEHLVGLYVHRVVSGEAPPAAPACRLNSYDGWCWAHECYHVAVAVNSLNN